jgi:lysophospholipase L1-like esterase
MPTAVAEETMLTDQQVQALSSAKVFFGHQSVGVNIIEGIRDIMASDARLQLNIVDSRNPEAVPGPAFVETHIGRNTDPASKNADFLAIMNQGFEGIALFKYCYIDIGETTDVQRMFNSYQAMIEQIHKDHPGVRIVHVTVPLTAVDSSPKSWLKGLLGRNTAQDDNLKRNQFNALLRQTYAKEPIFDLAEVESTREDGSRESFKNGNEIGYALASEYTTDGGHLNEAGRRIAAQRLLEVLAALN